MNRRVFCYSLTAMLGCSMISCIEGKTIPEPTQRRTINENRAITLGSGTNALRCDPNGATPFDRCDAGG
jgi:hypothetical protein